MRNSLSRRHTADFRGFHADYMRIFADFTRIGADYMRIFADFTLIGANGDGFDHAVTSPEIARQGGEARAIVSLSEARLPRRT
jgi:hypothetical protein